MSFSTNHELIAAQYTDSTNLRARGDLYSRFSTAEYDWDQWIFDRLDLPAVSRVLELGCRPGRLWVKKREKRERVPKGWHVHPVRSL